MSTGGASAQVWLIASFDLNTSSCSDSALVVLYCDCYLELLLSSCSVILCPQPRPRFILSLSRMFHVQLRFPLITLRVSGVPSCFPFSRHPLRILSESLAVPCYTAVVMANFFLTFVVHCSVVMRCQLHRKWSITCRQRLIRNPPDTMTSD